MTALVDPRPQDTAILPTVQDALALGLTRAEYELICAKQGEPPNEVELAMYSLLWSEHCAYKHSKQLLRALPTEGAHVVMGPGENAGAVDVGDGLVCAFKVESHNHPSAVEPFQGAATGVGGILRDIFAIGARPIAVLDSLRFGEPGADGSGGDVPATGSHARYLLDGAVSGIGHYGNSIGVPTVGGEVYFEGPYAQNCLVNAMALGLCARERLVRSAAAGVGNILVLFGAATGRDGIGGASVLASAELGDGGEDKRPTVQVGDPFAEKKLLECSLELLERDLVVALQDLGAAGLTSAAAEMAAKGEVGLDIDVAKVPLREPGLAPFEIMVSESQERMLCVVAPGDVGAVLALCAKWEVRGTAIGTVTDTRRMRIFAGERLVGDMPVRALVDECPLYDLAPAKPATPLYPPPTATLAASADPRAALLALLACPNIASRRPLFEQYDAIVQSRTVRRPEQADAAVLALPGGSALAVSIDCNGRRVAADPYRGTIAAVLECAANLACVGAQPLGTTNNLNFGNPEKPHIAWQLTESVRGLGEACRALAAPIVGGNVSLYNEGASGPIYPTPVIGMVGRLPDAARAGRLGFAKEGDAIALVGWGTGGSGEEGGPSLAASELAKLRGEPLPDGLPPFDLDAVIATQAAVRAAVRAGSLASAHDIAEGGLAVALAECCLAGGMGATVALDGAADPGASGPADAELAALFGEAPGGFVVSGLQSAIEELATQTSVRVLGSVGGELLRIDSLEWTLAELREAHSALQALFP
ncbi:MAG TPA: phosphoribosylformylglycinamidine synthase subunit PurL [Solirubrobacteraceae bacterium]|jgi:phosphoribosylformylglycinamidine synthase II|nr:phosphoribosylformylglycinamidine synthase subunit PurL [Solirubrobacteraceae bacterium]